MTALSGYEDPPVGSRGQKRGLGPPPIVASGWVTRFYGDEAVDGFARTPNPLVVYGHGRTILPVNPRAGWSTEARGGS